MRALVVLAGLAISSPALAKDIFVDPVVGKGHGYDGQTRTPTGGHGPMQSIWSAFGSNSNHAVAGDRVCVISSGELPAQGIVTWSGSNGNPIELDGTGCDGWNASHGLARRATIRQDSVNSNGFYVEAHIHDIKIHGFNLIGIKTSAYNGISTGFGIYRWEIFDNEISFFGGNGMNLFEGDYLDIHHNLVHDNSNYTANGINTSGISILGSTDLNSSGVPNCGDAVSIVKTKIHENVFYNNKNIGNGQHSDGNDIIADDPNNDWGLAGSPFPYQAGLWFDPNVYTCGSRPYKGKIFIYNNLHRTAGANAIHVYRWSGAPNPSVIVSFNSMWHSSVDVDLGAGNPGEIGMTTTPNAIIWGNIAHSNGLDQPHSVQNIPVSLGTNSPGAIVRYNVLYTDIAPTGSAGCQSNSPSYSASLVCVRTSDSLSGLTISNNVIGNPRMANPAGGDYQVPANSPAVNLVPNTGPYAVAADFAGNPRGAVSDAGAYERSDSDPNPTPIDPGAGGNIAQYYNGTGLKYLFVR